MIKKFGKLAQYKMYMKLMKENELVDKLDDLIDDELATTSDELNDVHTAEEPEVNRAEPGMFNSDNTDLMIIHAKLIDQYVPSQLIYDTKG